MSESNKYIIFVEVLKYPHLSALIKSHEFLSEKICYSTRKVRKKIITRVKWLDTPNSISNTKYTF